VCPSGKHFFPFLKPICRRFTTETDGVERWEAFVVTIPAISAETESREAELEEIRRQFADITTSEITTVPGPIPEKIVEGDGSELDLRPSKMGYRHYGIFANNHGALELFDEIERHGISRQLMNDEIPAGYERFAPLHGR
jgi:hypothetical protein